MKTGIYATLKGLVALLSILVFAALLVWILRLDKVALRDANAQSIADREFGNIPASVVQPASPTSESGYPGPIATPTSPSITPSPTVEIGIDG